MHKAFITLLLAVAVLSGCGPTNVAQLESSVGGKQLVPDDVLNLVEANTMLFSSGNEDSYFFFNRSGRVFGKDIYDNKDIGKWDVTTDGELCIRLENWWYGDLRCFTIYTNQDKYSIINSSGVIAFNAIHYGGDYKNLYYEVKAPKKSLRRSARKEQSSTARQTEQQQAETKDTVTETSPPEKTIYAPPPSPGELKSTVKWMAKDCPGCNLAKSNLKKADLVGAKLQGTNLSGANLSMANLRRANLQNANLEYADLSFANMPGANLQNCNLRGANLKGANLIRADLTGADLEGANLEGALLEGTRGLLQ